MFVSTTGDGEHCDSIQKTWKQLLQKSLPPFVVATPSSSSSSSSNPQLSFALFCLGDRAYGPQFCAAGRKLAVRLLQLGMSTACDMGYGDDNTPNGGVFCDLDVWLEQHLLPLFETRNSRIVGQLHHHCDVLTQSNSTDISNDYFSSPYLVQVMVENEESVEFVVPSDVEEWRKDRFRQSYRDYFAASCPITAYRYTVHAQRTKSEDVDTLARAHQYPLLGSMEVNQRITGIDWEQDTRHIRIAIPTDMTTWENEDDDPFGATTTSIAELPYQAGDVASILPFNSEKEVTRFLAVLPDTVSSLADTVIRIDTNESFVKNQHSQWPRLCTLRGWLTYCADLQSLPEREDLYALSQYCSPLHDACQNQSEKLSSLSESSQSALYADYILREKRTWADVLYDFESLRSTGSKLTLAALLVLLPRMRPREFSIASSPTADQIQRRRRDPKVTIEARAKSFSIELCVAVVKGTTRLGRQYHGLCSEYLSRLVPAPNHVHTLLLWIRPGTFGKLPLKLMPMSQSFEVPILCVSAGTGVAPMRSLILERNAVREMEQQKQKETDMVMVRNGFIIPNVDNILVFGCRKQSADYYYASEWHAMQTNNTVRVLSAFSRDQLEKIYVQKVLREADGGNLISRHILERGGAVYIAGGPKMARAVKEEVVESLSKHVGSEKRANQLLNKMQRAGTFSIEAWS
jgi:sulfite reductase alpha subunit-like flavoprotein